MMDSLGRTITRTRCEKMFQDKGFDYEIRDQSLSTSISTLII